MFCYIKDILIFTLILNLSLFLSTAYTQYSSVTDNLNEDYSQVKIEGSEVRDFQSTITGETYFIYVGLPRSYNDSVQTYPVMYIMDADGSFGTCTEITY